MFAPETWFDGDISPKIDPLNWFKMLGIVKKHIVEIYYLQLRNRLFDLINIQHEWSFEQIFSFIKDHERELDEGSLDKRTGLLWADFFVSAIKCKNSSIYKQVWDCIINSDDTDAIEWAWTQLVQIDDDKCSIGTLLFPSMDSLNKSQMPGEIGICRFYCDRLCSQQNFHCQ